MTCLTAGSLETSADGTITTADALPAKPDAFTVFGSAGVVLRETGKPSESAGVLSGGKVMLVSGGSPCSGGRLTTMGWCTTAGGKLMVKGG
jgi:hypothetical protein